VCESWVSGGIVDGFYFAVATLTTSSIADPDRRSPSVARTDRTPDQRVTAGDLIMADGSVGIMA